MSQLDTEGGGGGWAGEERRLKHVNHARARYFPPAPSFVSRRSDANGRRHHGSYRVRTNFRERSQKKAEKKPEGEAGGEPITKSINRSGARSFPAYRFLSRARRTDARCNEGGGERAGRGFHRETVRTQAVEINGPGARGRNEFPPRRVKNRLMT